MKSHHLSERLSAYLAANLDVDKLHSLILIDSLYDELPKDLAIFRQRFAHLDPRIIKKISKYL